MNVPLPARTPSPRLSKEEEATGTGVCIKEELFEGTVEERYLDIKEDYADGAAREEASGVEVKSEFLFLEDLHGFECETKGKPQVLKETKWPFPLSEVSSISRWKATMSFPSERTNEEMSSTGLDVKEESSEDLTDEMCLEIKEEALDYGDEARDEVCDVEATQECHFLRNLHDPGHEAVDSSWNLAKDRNDALKVPFVAEDCEERLQEEETQPEVELESGLAKHAVRTKEKPYNCEICRKTFSYKSGFLKHMIMHTEEKPYSCELCNKAFSRKHHLVRHVRAHTKKKPYVCEICSKGFAERGHLVTHIRVHTKEKPYKCEICDKVFYEKYRLMRHTRIHTKEKPYTCEICNKAFYVKGHLVTHTRVHTKEKPYSCEICGKSFSHKSSLVIHTRVHAKEKPYSCEICHRAFYEKSHVRRHMRVHTREKP